MIYNLLDSASILAGGIDSFIMHCLDGLRANEAQIRTQLDRMLMTVTNLTPLIGYDKCAEIAQKAFRENKTIRETIADMGLRIEGDLDELLDPGRMA